MHIRLFCRALALVGALMGSTLLPSFTNGATRAVPIELDSTAVSLPPALTTAVNDTLTKRPAGLLDGSHFRVTSAEVRDGWAVVSVVSLDEAADAQAEPTHAGALHSHSHTSELGGFSKLIVAQQGWNGVWTAALDGTPQFTQLAARTPNTVLDDSAKQILNQSDGLAFDPARGSTSAVTPNADNGDLIVDNQEGIFTSAGQLNEAACGINNHTNWTWASSDTDSVPNDVSGVWKPNIPRTGQYKVLAHIPTCSGITALTTNARYEIKHSGGTANVTINQQTQRGWVELGIWNFNAGIGGYTRLTDLTSESFDSKRAIMFDAIQWISPTQSPIPSPSSSPSPTPKPTPPPPPPGPTVNYKFPWAAGQSWGFWQGWHYNAHDLGTSSSDRRVLAAADGVVSSVYSCTLSSIIDIKHADGLVFRYIHIDRNSINPKYVRVGQAIKQGQVLGIVKPNTWNDGNCGYTNQSPGWAHNHWVMPTQYLLTVDGWTTYAGTDTWTKNGVVKTSGYSSASTLLSTNQPIPSFHERIFVPIGQQAAQRAPNPYP